MVDETGTQSAGWTTIKEVMDGELRSPGAPPQTPEFSALLPGSIHVGTGERSSPAIPASGSALGSLSSVALSSVRLGGSVSNDRLFTIYRDTKHST